MKIEDIRYNYKIVKGKLQNRLSLFIIFKHNTLYNIK